MVCSDAPFKYFYLGSDSLFFVSVGAGGFQGLSCVWFWFLASSIPGLNSLNRLKLLITLKTLRAAGVACVMGAVMSPPRRQVCAWSPRESSLSRGWPRGVGVPAWGGGVTQAVRPRCMVRATALVPRGGESAARAHVPGDSGASQELEVIERGG